MTNETAHKYMENEIRCIQRESKGICTKDCNDCEFDRDDDLLVEVYGMSVLALENRFLRSIYIMVAIMIVQCVDILLCR